MQDGEPLLIDMDRVSRGDPIIEISDLYYFYVVLGEDDPSVVEDFMGFSYATAKQFFSAFLRYYLETDDEDRIAEAEEKAALISCVRMINKIHKKGALSAEDRIRSDRYLERLSGLAEKTAALSLFS